MLCYTYIACLVIPLHYVIIIVLLSAWRLTATFVCTLHYTNLFPDHRRCHGLLPTENQYVSTLKLRALISQKFNLHYLFEEFWIADLQLLSRAITNWKYFSMLDGVLVLKGYHRFEYYLSSVAMTGPISNSVSSQIIISRIPDWNLACHHPQFISFRRIPLPLRPLKICLWESRYCTACSNSMFSYFSSIDSLNSSVRIKCTERGKFIGLSAFLRAHLTLAPERKVRHSILLKSTGP